jgi:hypothetical protein
VAAPQSPATLSEATPSPRRAKIGLLGVGIGVAAPFLVVPLLFVLSRDDDRICRFDRDAWLADHSHDRHVRHSMVDDLIAGRSLVGMARTNVEMTLGTPDHEASGSLEYRLGPHGYGPEDNWLLITMPSGRVEGLRISRH